MALYPRVEHVSVGLCGQSASFEMMLAPGLSVAPSVSLTKQSVAFETRAYVNDVKNQETYFFVRGSTRNNVAVGLGVKNGIFHTAFGVYENLSYESQMKPFVSVGIDLF